MLGQFFLKIVTFGQMDGLIEFIRLMKAVFPRTRSNLAAVPASDLRATVNAPQHWRWRQQHRSRFKGMANRPRSPINPLATKRLPPAARRTPASKKTFAGRDPSMPRRETTRQKAREPR